MPRGADEPDKLEPRLFKTAMSFLCYLTEMGITTVTLPMCIGRCSVQREV